MNTISRNHFHGRPMRLVRIGLLFLGISLPVPALSTAEPSLSIPHIDPGGCPGEMCGYSNQELIAQKDTVARAHYGRSAQETYRIRRGERLHAIDGVVITNKPLILKVMKSCELTQGVSGRPGDLIYVLWYEGENFAKAWHRGRYFDIEGDGPKGCTEVVSPDVEAVWWVKVKNVAGKIGWVEGDQFHDQGRYASHVPEAEWLVLRKGETKLGYSFMRDGRLLHRDQLLESNLDNSVQKALVSATPPQFWVVCTRFELEPPSGIDLPKVNESCNLRVEMPENRFEYVSNLWPGMVRFASTNYMVLYHDPSIRFSDSVLADGSVHVVDLHTGKPGRVPIALSGNQERQFIDFDSMQDMDNGFIVNVYVGCDPQIKGCDRRYTRSHRVHVDLPSLRVTSLDTGSMTVTGIPAETHIMEAQVQPQGESGVAGTDNITIELRNIAATELTDALLDVLPILSEKMARSAWNNVIGQILILVPAELFMDEAKRKLLVKYVVKRMTDQVTPVTLEKLGTGFVLGLIADYLAETTVENLLAAGYSPLHAGFVRGLIKHGAAMATGAAMTPQTWAFSAAVSGSASVAGDLLEVQSKWGEYRESKKDAESSLKDLAEQRQALLRRAAEAEHTGDNKRANKYRNLADYLHAVEQQLSSELAQSWVR